MRGNCSPLSQSTTRRPPKRVFICTKCGHPRHGANALRATAQRVRAHGGQQLVGYLGGANGDELALVGHVQRVQAQQFAGGLHLGQHRNVRLLNHHAHLRLARDFVERGGQSAARGVAQHMQGGWGRARPAAWLAPGCAGRRCRSDGGLELQRLAQRHHRHAVLTHVPETRMASPGSGLRPSMHRPGRDAHARWC
jgi:hypothetical protein